MPARQRLASFLGATSALAALAMGPSGARAQVLKIVEVGAPAINCVFRPDCIIPVSDSQGFIPLPFVTPANSAWLQSRTFTALPGAPAAGFTGYEYRISLTQASGSAECLGGLVLNFGPIAKLPYKPGEMADVFVVTTGGLGTIGIKAATKLGDIVEFEFSKPLCLSGPPDIKNTTFFFGLAAATAPMAAKGHIWAVGSTPVFEVDARVPTH